MMLNYIDGAVCPICGDGKELILTKKTRIGNGCMYSTCVTCGLVKRNPKLELEIAKDIYKSGYYYDMNYPNKQIVRDYDKNASDRYGSDLAREKFLHNIIDSRKLSILEIGCGVGSFAGLLQSRGHRVLAIEPDPEAAKYASEKYSIEVFNNVYEEVANNLTRYDLVVMLHVFEHLVDPVQFLNEIKLNLVKGGLLFIEVPNILNLSTEFPEWYQGYDATHAYNYSVNSLTNILALGGFRVELKQVGNVLRFVCSEGNYKNNHIEIDHKIYVFFRSQLFICKHYIYYYIKNIVRCILIFLPVSISSYLLKKYRRRKFY